MLEWYGSNIVTAESQGDYKNDDGREIAINPDQLKMSLVSDL